MCINLMAGFRAKATIWNSKKPPSAPSSRYLLSHEMEQAQAAMKLQTMYRSFRQRRLLADTIIMELWGHAINFTRLNISTTFFFQCLNERCSNTRWTRIGFNASMVGRGLSESNEGQILAFDHWIEAIDPRHRYGHLLRLYYNQWCSSNVGQPFFYWLDIGAGKEMDLKECPRSILQERRVKYLGPLERNHYEYLVSKGKLVHKESGHELHTVEGSQEAKWIFVFSTSGRLYVGKKEKGRFHHSSFMAGGATVAAGSLVAEHGILKSISRCSGHYRPGDDSLKRFLCVLRECGVNLNGVQVTVPAHHILLDLCGSEKLHKWVNQNLNREIKFESISGGDRSKSSRNP